MTTVWYVHGSGGSKTSFTWLRQQIGRGSKFFSYQVDETADSCIERLRREIAAEPAPVILIGHSLGGIIALACAGRTSNIAALVTLCAPFGGLQHASFAAFFSNVPMFREMQQYSPLLIDVRSRHVSTAHLAIVASHGLPHINQTNDGVVTLTSQTALTGITYVNFPINHFEVLLSPEVAATINEFLAR
jgi:pimeloyl-ACP methyl ester carboxylesterase